MSILILIHFVLLAFFLFIFYCFWFMHKTIPTALCTAQRAPPPHPWNGLKEISRNVFIITSLSMCELVKAVPFLTHKRPGWSIWGSGPTPSLIYLPKTFNLSILSPLWWKCTKHLISHSFKEIVGLKRRLKKRNSDVPSPQPTCHPHRGFVFCPLYPHPAHRG